MPRPNPTCPARISTTAKAGTAGRTWNPRTRRARTGPRSVRRRGPVRRIQRQHVALQAATHAVVSDKAGVDRDGRGRSCRHRDRGVGRPARLQRPARIRADSCHPHVGHPDHRRVHVGGHQRTASPTAAYRPSPPPPPPPPPPRRRRPLRRSSRRCTTGRAVSPARTGGRRSASPARRSPARRSASPRNQFPARNADERLRRRRVIRSGSGRRTRDGRLGFRSTRRTRGVRGERRCRLHRRGRQAEDHAATAQAGQHRGQPEGHHARRPLRRRLVATVVGAGRRARRGPRLWRTDGDRICGAAAQVPSVRTNRIGRARRHR